MPRVIFLMCICLISFFACEKPNKPDPAPPENPDSVQVPDRNKKINAKVTGFLLSENGTPYEMGGSNYGFVGFNDIRSVGRIGQFSVDLPSTNEDPTILHADFDNNIPMSAPLILVKDRIHFVQKRVVNKYHAPAVQGPTGRYSSFNNPGVTANALALQYGDSSWMDYTRNEIYLQSRLIVKFKWLGATSLNKDELQPGDMRGINARNELVIINPYVIVGFTADGDYNAGKIDIAPGKKIMASVQMDNMDLATAPATAPVWEYDMKDGLWKETGTAQRVGDRYQCAVSKKGYFSIAQQSPAVFVRLRFVDEEGYPLAFVKVNFEQPTPGRPLNKWRHQLYTNNQGEVFSYIPADKACSMSVWETPCATSGRVVPIGPLKNNYQKTIEVKGLTINSCLIEGKALACNGEPIREGWFVVRKGGQYDHVFPFTDGQYSFRIPVCEGDANAEYRIDDLNSGKTTGYKPLSLVVGGKISFPDTQLCN